jgi:hypothetical protein
MTTMATMMAADDDENKVAALMICHTVYDVGDLMWAHWTATALPLKEQDYILESGPLAPIMDAGQLNSSNK